MNKYDETVTGQITLPHGTPITWEVDYDIGEYNQFTGDMIPRGYRLFLYRNRQEVSAFQGLDEPNGAESILIIEVKRQSHTGLTTALAKVPTLLEQVSTRYPEL